MQSMFNLGEEVVHLEPIENNLEDRVYSADIFDQNVAKLLQAPENQLMKHGKVMSENELRIQRSLQKLDLPDWYRNSASRKPDFSILRRKSAAEASNQSPQYQSTGGGYLSTSTAKRTQRWTGFGTSKSCSVTSLRSGTITPTRNALLSSKRAPTPEWRYGSKTSKESLVQSPMSGNPSPSLSPREKYGGFHYYSSFTRWSSSRLSNTSQTSGNSETTSPIPPAYVRRTQSPFQRTPYLGWRSSERLSREITNRDGGPPIYYKGTAERLASSGLGYYALRFGLYNGPPIDLDAKDEKGDNSIGIKDSDISSNSMSPHSPRNTMLWLESSFVGVRPIKVLSVEETDDKADNKTDWDDYNSDSDGYDENSSPNNVSPAKRNNATGVNGELPPDKTKKADIMELRNAHIEQICDLTAGVSEDVDSPGYSPKTPTTYSQASGNSRLEDVLDALLGMPARTPSPNTQPKQPVHQKHIKGIVDDNGNKLSDHTVDDVTEYAQNVASSTTEHEQQLLQCTPNALASEQCGGHGDNKPNADLAQINSACDSNQVEDSMDESQSPTMLRKLLNDVTNGKKVHNSPKHHRGNGAVASPRKKAKFVTIDESVIVKCSYEQCENKTELKEARKHFKMCHNCYTFYCTRECRKQHWEIHRKTCMYSRVRSMCKHVILKARDDHVVQAHLSKIARTGMAIQGRGFVKMMFTSTETLERFLKHGWTVLEDMPIYVAYRDLVPQELGSDTYRDICDTCTKYDPESRMVFVVAVYITREVPAQPVPRWEREVVAKCCKVPLTKNNEDLNLPYHQHTETDTLILTAVVTPNTQTTPQKSRELCFNNILKHLHDRGVSLKHQYPDVYKKLAAYVDKNEPFHPITIYPKDGRTGKTFTCSIMPNCDSELQGIWAKNKAIKQ